LPDPVTGDIVIEMGAGTVGKEFTGLRLSADEGISKWIIENRQPYLSNQVDSDALFARPDRFADSRCVAIVPMIAKEQAIGALCIARQTDLVEQDLRLFSAVSDIAANALHRVTLHEQTEIHLRHLVALHQIDLAITTNFDLGVTLNVILNNVRNELEADAASILLLSPFTQNLEYAAGAGFRTQAIERTRVKLGAGHAGQAALKYQTIICPDLRRRPPDFMRVTLTEAEEFLSHFVAPLIVKGQVKGVLEVFQRKPFEPGHDWRDYFETLATQTAIAIENAALFENLQRSNTELKLAYDATIEGWSRALDLRDKETEGHTLRVTEMALRLAEKMGMSDSEKVNLRRGALLHDIGKMGVPDRILLKEGPLTEDEWVIMRQHPVYAHEMLRSIEYLRTALDIPYCHHEKWDGTGYPRCLHGDDIPLPARIFAVVDVWDALTSDRPYRPAWAPSKVLAHIREQSGKHFDAQVVHAFIELMSERRAE
jgi:putative nucleotidyltransferase with HDIG domain